MNSLLSISIIALLSLSACIIPISQNANKLATTTMPSSLTFNLIITKPLPLPKRSKPCRASENIPYVANPTEPDYQVMNLYIPEPYFAGDSINGYTADTAPIFFSNGVGRYMPAKPMTAESRAGRDGKPRPNSVVSALMRGYVVASAGARGRTLGTDGNYTGKAPSVIVDLKSAIAYLKANGRTHGRASRPHYRKWHVRRRGDVATFGGKWR